MGQFRHHHSGKTRTMAFFWLRMSYHAQRYMFQRYMLRSLLTQSFNIVNSPIILLFSKKWVPGFAAEDNKLADQYMNRKCHPPHPFYQAYHSPKLTIFLNTRRDFLIL